MSKIQQYLVDQLEIRRKDGLLRSLQHVDHFIDFCSNDYLGLAKNQELNQLITKDFENWLAQNNGQIPINGATGSRLISGNNSLVENFEIACAQIHHAEAALLFGSGFEANLGLLSSISQADHIVFCDQLLHASIIDGIRLGKGKKVIFKHNDWEALSTELAKYPHQTKWVVVESIYSMDGDQAPLQKYIELKQLYDFELIVDEAHSGGVHGFKGAGLVQELGLVEQVFARVITFGKAWGNAGAVVLGSQALRQYLINFARSFIYSTGPTPAHICALLTTLHFIQIQDELREKLKKNITFFQEHNSHPNWGKSQSAIQTFIVPGNQEVRRIAQVAQEKGFGLKPIVYPTVPKEEERIRITLSALTQQKDMLDLIQLLESNI
ncbi:8-amino-7-oxononanoate synthase [Aquirufa nivalisilvae]|uniref:8-amino-7-oxononanoate synthase n=1 Tax=Aquirufa nivalisilvae TaxID=2516557 RepID=A0A2S2DXC4_9BACT|nr:8-amino-7-oxononanoate synthase [Aquirufa nivalisilvae]AWL09993.1 8-amino-7-oxononanoate synthase [Aquirufa nivalisilvae]